MVNVAILTALSETQRAAIIKALKTAVATKMSEPDLPAGFGEENKQVYRNALSGILQLYIEAEEERGS
ncbi:hypothetical protein [Bradyrhizobium sp. CCH5-F6]|uniref:hypothetical protein n=1 Tax=Bradyrhizobium sp. CCH5-F6 TaxID=1768753 RepID=UPI00076A7FBE|nr:hypothetical protein [Bradyrhizobium sp. CCH5-F6]